MNTQCFRMNSPWHYLTIWVQAPWFNVVIDRSSIRRQTAFAIPSFNLIKVHESWWCQWQTHYKLVSVTESLFETISMSMTLHLKVNDNAFEAQTQVWCQGLCLTLSGNFALFALFVFAFFALLVCACAIHHHLDQRMSLVLLEWRKMVDIRLNQNDITMTHLNWMFNHLSARSIAVISSKSVRFRPINCAAIRTISRFAAVNANYMTIYPSLTITSAVKHWHWKPWVHAWGANQGRVKLPHAASSCRYRVQK